MILGIDPKVDYAFKHLFGREATKPILIDVINAVLRRPSGRLISQIELKNPFNPKEWFDDKLSIVDIKARDEAGWFYNLEMQLVPRGDYEKRVLYYWARIYQQQLIEGDDYGKLNPTISISFIDRMLFRQTPEHHSHFRLLETLHGFPMTDHIEFHILELPKFTKPMSQLTDRLDFWLYFFRHVENMDVEALPPFIQQQPVMVQAVEELKVLTKSEIERERYDARKKVLLDELSLRLGSLREGRAEGERNRLIKEIHKYEQLLKRDSTSPEQLASLSTDDLSRLSDELLEKLITNK
jgi:predicted transposase/invertase (TIGR01784 family)